ncbi:DUF2239 family protein [Sphingomonas cavernae]|uniref:DUF2239 family protein n=1 Tax=Sphingomonas cavernae TaxID=2320861 RepID=A0A418WKI8_9SPHN|nr:DUF2239 family protein [Sphingomonas cavernae]RJF90557.1 DUF2239 family protein [Sphingomonas cavernae]
MDSTCTAFVGDIWIASGAPDEVRDTMRSFDNDRAAGALLVFDDETGRQIDLDMRMEEPARARGRPRLGVIAREVTLLPRHWEWLRTQQGGASVTLRRLIDDARKHQGRDPRTARDATYHFLSAIAGDKPGFEEAIRALYAGDEARFNVLVGDWPVGIRDHARSLAEGAWS